MPDNDTMELDSDKLIFGAFQADEPGEVLVVVGEDMPESLTVETLAEALAQVIDAMLDSADLVDETSRQQHAASIISRMISELGLIAVGE